MIYILALPARVHVDVIRRENGSDRLLRYVACCLNNNNNTATSSGEGTSSTYNDDSSPTARCRCKQRQHLVDWSKRLLEWRRTCRQIYNETVPLLYTTPTFILQDPFTFNLFASIVPEPDFAIIQSLRLELTWSNVTPTSAPTDTETVRIAQWEKVCSAIARLQGLQWLVMDTTSIRGLDKERAAHRAAFGDVVDAVKGNKGLKVFDMKPFT